jgi:hypothetical protein
VAATFWEWRNKVMAFCFTAAGALFVIAGWLYKNIDHELAALPLLVGATISVGCIKLEWRNHRILGQCYRIGAAIETIAVGTALSGGPPRRSQRARLTHWAPALGDGVKALLGPGMRDTSGGQPTVGVNEYSRAANPVALATTP